jgi:kynurenine formamidase
MAATATDDLLAQLLAPARLVDLSQPLGPETVLWPGTAPLRATVVTTHEGDGAYSRSLEVAEHSGTHLDAPGHFAEGGATVDVLELGRLVRPAAVLDVRSRCGDDPDYAVSLSDVEADEDAHGPIAAGAAVLVCTGWDRHLPRRERYAGPDGRPRFPGVGPDAARLIVARGAAGLGIDTLGVDAGSADGFPTHRITQPAGLWHLEALVRLNLLPPRGAWLVAAPPPLVDGSGVPVRAFAVLPPD